MNTRSGKVTEDRIVGLEGDVLKLQADVEGIKTRLDEMNSNSNTRFDAVSGDIAGVKGQIDELKNLILSMGRKPLGNTTDEQPAAESVGVNTIDSAADERGKGLVVEEPKSSEALVGREDAKQQTLVAQQTENCRIFPLEKSVQFGLQPRIERLCPQDAVPYGTERGSFGTQNMGRMGFGVGQRTQRNSGFVAHDVMCGQNFGVFDGLPYGGHYVQGESSNAGLVHGSKRFGQEAIWDPGRSKGRFQPDGERREFVQRFPVGGDHLNMGRGPLNDFDMHDVLRDQSGGQPMRAWDTRVRKLEMPVFEGKGADEWVYRAERYFVVNGLSEVEKLSAAALCLEGQALAWFRWREERNPIYSWAEFKACVLERFRGQRPGENHEEFFALTQLTTVAAYRDRFEALSGGLYGVSDEALMGNFMKETEVLIKWTKLPEHDATWERADDIIERFPDFDLEDKVILWEGGNDRTLPETHTDGDTILEAVQVAQSSAGNLAATLQKRPPEVIELDEVVVTRGSSAELGTQLGITQYEEGQLKPSGVVQMSSTVGVTEVAANRQQRPVQVLEQERSESDEKDFQQLGGAGGTEMAAQGSYSVTGSSSSSSARELSSAASIGAQLGVHGQLVSQLVFADHGSLGSDLGP